jgi:hypothetical protein
MTSPSQIPFYCFTGLPLVNQLPKRRNEPQQEETNNKNPETKHSKFPRHKLIPLTVPLDYTSTDQPTNDDAILLTLTNVVARARTNHTEHDNFDTTPLNERTGSKDHDPNEQHKAPPSTPPLYPH